MQLHRHMRTTPLLGLFALTLAVPAATGCSGASHNLPEAVQARLRPAQSCADLEQALKADALRKMNDAIDREIAWVRRYNDTVWGYGTLEAPNAAADGAGASGGAKGDSATSYSQTNDQVRGVDEGDFVKNDGKYIYLLHGQTFQVIQAWPAPQMSRASTIQIDGYPQEMFVDSGKVVVFSTVDPTPVLQAAGLPQRDAYYDYVGYGVELAGGGGVRGGAPANDAACYPGGGCGWYGGGFTKITVLTLDQNEQPAVVGESWLEGSYFSSRKIDSKVRAVVNGGAHGPAVSYWPSDYYQAHSGQPNWRPSTGELIDAYERLRAANAKLIQASTAADWLPYEFSRSGGGIAAKLTRCEDYLVPTEGSTQWGLTQIATLDLGSPAAAPNVTAVVGQTDTLYSSTGHMVLAARGWMPYAWYWGWDEPPPDVTLDYTHLHSFDLNADPSRPAYEGSGTIPGSIGDQFSIDEKDGVLRVTSTEHRTHPAVATSGGRIVSTMQQATYNHLYTLRPNGGRLERLGETGDLAVGESIYSTRFVGDRGYVVTFRQVDPLFVVDLKDPAKPAVVGSVTIPGFSSYMHPIDDTHLLTIGRDVDPNTNRQGSLMLQIFDVTNPTSPALAQKFVYDTSSYGYSEAQYDHKAFTYFPDRKLLAFPYWGYDQTSAHSSAELFRVDVQAGIQKLGSVDHTALLGTHYTGWCGGWFTPSVRRTVFMDDVLFSISYAGVIATDTKTMGNVSTLALDAPRFDWYASCR